MAAWLIGALRPAEVVVALVVVVASAGCAPGAAVARGGELELRFVLPKDFPAEVSVHRLASGQAPTEARAYAEGEPPVLGAAVVDRRVQVEFDRAEAVIVVVRNASDRPLRFWSAPHLPSPHAAEPALMIRCLCTGETYEIPPRGTWTRAIEVGIRRRDAVAQLVVTHVITEGEAPAPRR